MNKDYSTSRREQWRSLKQKGGEPGAGQPSLKRQSTNSKSYFFLLTTAAYLFFSGILPSLTMAKHLVRNSGASSSALSKKTATGKTISSASQTPSITSVLDDMGGAVVVQSQGETESELARAAVLSDFDISTYEGIREHVDYEAPVVGGFRKNKVFGQLQASISVQSETLLENKCPPGRYFDGNDTTPASGSLCKDCPIGCSSCTSNDTCDSCEIQYGFFLDPVTKTCEKCTAGCLQCESLASCDVCHPSSFAHNGVCFCSARTEENFAAGTEEQILDYSMFIIPSYLGVNQFKIHLVTDNVDYDQDLFLEDTSLNCTEVLTLRNLTDATSIPYPASMQCAVYRVNTVPVTKPWSSKVLISITGLDGDDIAKLTLKEVRGVLNNETAQVNCFSDSSYGDLIFAFKNESQSSEHEDGFCMQSTESTSAAGSGICTKCIKDQLLDLETFKCVDRCINSTVPLRSSYTFMSDKYSRSVGFCRAFDNDTKQVTLYVSSLKSTSRFEAGTKNFPFSNLAFAFIESFDYNPVLSFLGLSFKILLAPGEHSVYSGRLPLCAYNSNITLQPLLPGTNPTLRFKVLLDDTELEQYYLPLFGRSIASLNYVYKQLLHSAVGYAFHDLYPLTYLTAYEAQISITGLQIIQQGQLKKDDAIIQIIGDSQIEVRQSRVVANALVLNNKPTNVTIEECNVSCNSTNYFINAKQQLTDAPSFVTVTNSHFIDDSNEGNVAHTYPIIYVQGYQNVSIENCTFESIVDQKGMPSIIIAYSNNSQQVQASTVFKGNQVVNARDFGIFMASQQGAGAAPLNWTIEISNNQFSSCQQYYLNLIKVTFNEPTIGSLLMQGNSFKRVRLLQPTSVVSSHSFTFPNQTTPVILVANVTEVRLQRENYSHIDVFKALNVKNAAFYQMSECTFEDLRTPQICNSQIFGTMEMPTSFFNAQLIAKAIVENNMYVEATLGRNRFLQRFTNCSDVTVSGNVFSGFTYFALARVSFFQDFAALRYHDNRFLNFHPVDQASGFLVWVLNSHDQQHNVIVQFLSNTIQIDRAIGFLRLENDDNVSAVTLEYRNQKFEAAYGLETANEVKIIGNDVVTLSDMVKEDFCLADQIYNLTLKQCQACPLENCEVCGGRDFCFACGDGFKFDPLVKECVPSQTQSLNKWCPYFYDGGNATTYCGDGSLYDSESGACKSCLDHCQVCSDFDTCELCQFGFVYHPEKRRCQAEDPSSEFQQYMRVEAKTGPGCIYATEDFFCTSCGFSTLQRTYEGSFSARCDCRFEGAISLLLKHSESNPDLPTQSMMVTLENLVLNPKLNMSQLTYSDLFKTEDAELDSKLANLTISNYTEQYIEKDSADPWGVYQFTWLPRRSQFWLHDVPMNLYEAFFGVESATTFSVKLDPFKYNHCQYPIALYGNTFQIQQENITYDADPALFTTRVVKGLDISPESEQEKGDWLHMELQTTEGYAFSTYYGATLTTSLKTQEPHDPPVDPMTNMTLFDQKLFCDMFIRDPIFKMDVKINSKHYHFSPLETNSTSFNLEMKTNLPYFPQLTVLAKCKKINSEQEEANYVNESMSIPYEFEASQNVSVSINTKFYTLYSTGETMKLPLIYLLRYQLLAFRSKLTDQQMKKAYDQMLTSLKALQPETLDDKLLKNLLLQALSEEITYLPAMMSDPQSTQKIIDAIQNQIVDNATSTAGNGTTSLDVVNSQPVSYKPVDEETLIHMGSTIDNLMTNQNSGSSSNKQFDLVATYAMGIDSYGAGMDQNTGLQLVGQSISSTVMKVNSSQVAFKGTHIQVKPAQTSQQETVGGSINITIPPKIEAITSTNQVLIKAVSVAPDVVANTELDAPTSQTFASQILVMNLDKVTQSDTDVNGTSKTYLENVKLNNLPDPVLIDIPLSNVRPYDTYQCSYYDNEAKAWVPLPGESNTKEADGVNKIQCLTNHFSQFAVLARRSDQRASLVAIIIVLDLLLVGCFIAAYFMDKRAPNKDFALREGEGSFSRSRQQQRQEGQYIPRESAEDQAALLKKDFDQNQSVNQALLSTFDQSKNLAVNNSGYEDQDYLEMHRITLSGAIIKHHKLINQFTQGGASRKIKTIANQSLFHIMLVSSAILVTMYPFTSHAQKFGLGLGTFALVRFVHFLHSKLFLSPFASSGFRYFTIFLLTLLFIASQIVPVVLTTLDTSRAKDTAILAGSLILFEVFAWDLIVLPLSSLFTSRWKASQRESTHSLSDLSISMLRKSN